MLKNVSSEHSVTGQIGQEAAILNYIAALSPEKMKGRDLCDEMISQQLMSVGEDLYQQLVRQKTKMASLDEAKAFWDKGNKNSSAHNRQFSVHVYLDMLEQFYNKTPWNAHFTASGCTVGECKLWGVLHAFKWIQHDIFAEHEGLNTFYERFLGEAATQAIVSGEKTGGPLAKYFLEPEQYS